MTTIRQNFTPESLKEELRQLRKTAKKIAASKDSARRFLISTGLYNSSGQLKRQYR